MPTVVVLVLSIRPGCTQRVKELIRSRPTVDGWVARLATEVGEVNTFWDFHTCQDLAPTLLRLQAWLDGLRRDGGERYLRHVRIEAFQADPQGAPIASLAREGCAAVLLQQFEGSPAPGGEGAVVLRPLSGLQGGCWVLRPAATQDGVVDMALSDARREDLAIGTSAMLVAVD